MPKGGARTKSGPAKDPNSRTSERAGFTLTALPASGYDGETPDLLDFMPEATPRHGEVWAELWSTPQACAWSAERWRWLTIADLVRCMVRAENPEAPAAWQTPIRQLREDLGLSESGLRFHGWAIAPAAVEPDEAPKDELAPKRERRLREPVAKADAQ